jgi:hypothetical protein
MGWLVKYNARKAMGGMGNSTGKKSFYITPEHLGPHQSQDTIEFRPAGSRQTLLKPVRGGDHDRGTGGNRSDSSSLAITTEFPWDT